MLSYTVPANSLVAGSIYRVSGYASRTGNSNTTSTFRLRVGTTTLTGSIVSSVTIGQSGTPSPLFVEMMFTVQTVGSSGTSGTGAARSIYASTTLDNTVAGGLAVNTTVDNLLELTAVTANSGNSFVFNAAAIQKIY